MGGSLIVGQTAVGATADVAAYEVEHLISGESVSASGFIGAATAGAITGGLLGAYRTEFNPEKSHPEKLVSKLWSSQAAQERLLDRFTNPVADYFIQKLVTPDQAYAEEGPSSAYAFGTTSTGVMGLPSSRGK
jgi:hypothetical protein